MDTATIQTLRQLNNDFYRRAAESFSKSRQTAWPGWQRIAQKAEVLPDGAVILDVACGNLRFERYLQELLPEKRFSYVCLDSCTALPEPLEAARFIEYDVIDALAAGKGTGPIEPSSCDMAVSFGFMHHVPSEALRKALVRLLIEYVRPAGLVALSFWQFMQDEKLAAKARATTREARESFDLALEQGDYLLSWNDESGLYRYCHDYSDGEVEALMCSISDEVDIVDTFNADGRNNALNKYVVLRKR